MLVETAQGAGITYSTVETVTKTHCEIMTHKFNNEFSLETIPFFEMNFFQSFRQIVLLMLMPASESKRE